MEHLNRLPTATEMRSEGGGGEWGGRAGVGEMWRGRRDKCKEGSEKEKKRRRRRGESEVEEEGEEREEVKMRRRGSRRIRKVKQGAGEAGQRAEVTVRGKREL